MKVLLVQPPIEDFYDTSIRTYPLSLLCLATKIKDICHVSVADFRSNKRRMLKAHPFPGLMSSIAMIRSPRFLCFVLITVLA